MTEVGISMGPDALRAPGGTAAGRSGRRRRPARRAPGAQARGRAAPHRMGDHRTRPRVVVAVRRVRLVLDRAGRPPHPRRADRVLRVRLQRRHLAAGASGSIPTSTSTTRPPAGARRREHDRARQPGAAAQRGRDRARQRRPDRASRHPHELLRRPARHGGDGRGHAPGARRRRELAGAPRDRSADGPAVARREARARRGRHAERRAARGPRAPLLVHRVPPDVDLPDGQTSSIRGCGSTASPTCASPTPASCPTS